MLFSLVCQLTAPKREVEIITFRKTLMKNIRARNRYIQEFLRNFLFINF